MPTENEPKVPSRSWRESIARAITRPEDIPAWKRATAEEGRPRFRLWSKQSKIGLTSLGFLGLTFLLIWACTWLIPPRHACLVLIGSNYETNLAIPPNIYGWQGLVGLGKLSESGRSRFLWGWEGLRVHQEATELRTGEAWDQDLGNFNEKTVVIFLALHGGADTKGAYLLPGNAGANDTAENRLRLTKILDDIAKLPAEKNKILLLDATQVAANWSLGMIQNDFVRSLIELDDRIRGIPNLIVISSTDVNQLSHVSEEWRQTAFAHFIIEGLNGASEDRNNDGRISALELLEYLKPTVERWVRDNRGGLQTPLLLPLKDSEGKDDGPSRASRIDLTLVTNYVAPNIQDLPEFTPPPNYAQVWGHAQDLAQQRPFPAVYSPQLWRLYQEYLLRFEQLIRAGDHVGASKIKEERLVNLENEIRAQRYLTLRSMQNTFAMPAVAGHVLEASQATTAQFQKLWDSPPPEYGKVWLQIKKEQTTGQRIDEELLRMEFYALIVDRVIRDADKNLATAVQLVKILNDSTRPTPIEVHVMLMAQRDTPVSPPSNEWLALLQLALRVSVLGERTALVSQPHVYSYSEFVFPWLKKSVDDGDTLRRRGLDLLFTNDSKHWDDARDVLQKAEKQYLEIQTQAELLRSAISVRDQATASLPFFAQWVATRRDGEESPTQGSILTLANIQKVWNDTHALNRLLNTHDLATLTKPPMVTPDNPKPRSIEQVTKDVQTGFTKIQQNFAQYCQDLSDVDTQTVLRDADNALLVPFTDPLLRLKLLTNMRRISRRLLIETSKRSATGMAPIEKQDNKKWTQERARREGLMSLACLGSYWFDNDPQRNSPETYQQVLYRLNTFSAADKWWESVNIAGEEIGYRWRDLPAEINKLDQEAATQQPDAALKSLRTASELARIINGAECHFLKYNPARKMRYTRVGMLLLDQTRRCLDDHWFAEDPTMPPYYRTAGEIYLADAVIDPRPRTKQSISELQAKLSQSGQLEFAGPQSLQITTEQTFGTSYQLRPAAGAWLPNGLPVAWVNVGDGIKVQLPEGPNRIVESLEQGNNPKPIETRFASPVLNKAQEQPPDQPNVKQTQITINALFRGQRVTRETRVDLFLLADKIVARQPLPRTGSIAVRAAGELQSRFGASNGGIAIVLDCSGSMGPVQEGKFTPTTKYVEATKALRDVLQTLPKGTKVSVWVFGQAIGTTKTVQDAERTVRRVQAPVAWNPDSKELIQGVMSKIEYPALEPWNESPIVASMVAAKSDLKDIDGFKTLLVITDGMDNRFEKDARLNPKKLDIPTFLRNEFKNSGIEINIVGFKIVNEEEKKAKEQFLVIQDLPVPGKWYTVNDAKELAGTMGRAMRQRIRYWIDTDDNVRVTGVPEAGLDVSRSGDNDQWYPKGLFPAIYKLRMFLGRRLEKYIYVGRGDLLLINVLSDGKDILFERVLWSKSDFPMKPAKELNGWRLAVLQNQQVGEAKMQGFVTLERTQDLRANMLQQIKPRDAWFELSSSTKNLFPFSQRWTVRPGYPAPAWGVDVPAWPTEMNPAAPGGNGPAVPTLQAWWNPDQETRIATALDRGADFQSLKELTNRKLQVDGDEVSIEDAAVEEHFIETSPGQREKVSCLVVRVNHARGKPLLVELRGLQPAGQAHYFFTQPSKATAYFWPVKPEEAAKSLQSIGLISVTDYKRRAERRGYFLEMELNPPQPDDSRPQQPIQLK